MKVFKEDIEKIFREASMNKLEGIFLNEGLTSEQEAELEKLGWIVMNQGDYLDIQFEVTYEEETDKHDRYSINLQFTVGHDRKESYLVLGDNLGNGFNSHVDISLDNLELLESFDNVMTRLLNADQSKVHLPISRALHLARKYPECYEGIRKEGITKLESWLKAEAA